MTETAHFTFFHMCNIKILIALNILHAVFKLLVNPKRIVVSLRNSEEKHHTTFS